MNQRLQNLLKAFPQLRVKKFRKGAGRGSGDGRTGGSNVTDMVCEGSEGRMGLSFISSGGTIPQLARLNPIGEGLGTFWLTPLGSERAGQNYRSSLQAVGGNKSYRGGPP